MGLKELLEETQCTICKHQSACFKLLNEEELQHINKFKKQLVYKKGETICKQGAASSEMLYVAKGMVKTHLEGMGNKNVNIDLILSKDFLDLSLLFDDKAYFNFTATAMEDTTICMIDKVSFNGFIERNVEFAKEVVRWHAHKVTRLYQVIHSHVHKQMHGKFATTLLYLTQGEYLKNETLNKLSRKDLAEFSNLSTESTVRIINEFKKEGLISLSGKNIIIHDDAMLKKISILG